MKFHNKIISSIIVVSLIFSFINISSAIKVEQKTIFSDEHSLHGYIVKFDDEPLFKHIKDLSNKLNDFSLNENLQKYKEKLISLHKKAKYEINKLIGYDNSIKDLFSSEFYNLFNGICINKINNDELSKIKNLSYVKEIIPNYKIYINLDKSTPLIGAEEIWEYHDNNGKNIVGSGIKIAIFDTGVNYKHPDLKENYIGGYDFVNNDTDPMDDNGHGTHCAGIALGTGRASDFKNVGVAPMADLYVYKVLNNEGVGDLSSVLKAFDQALIDGIDVISISFGNNEELAFPNSTLSLAADSAVEAGMVVVASAGNDGELGSISSPACARKVICVGATDDFDHVAGFSSRGPVELGNGKFLIKPDIVAPGVNIKSCDMNNGYKVLSGTSMSAPHVAGASALILQKNPDLKPEEVKEILKENALNLGLDKNISGEGRLNISACIKINDETIVKSPYRVTEGNNFKVSITDKNETPIKAFVILWNPYHLPRFKFGDLVIFNAPDIINSKKTSIKGKIFVINFKRKLFNSYEIIVSNKILITH